MRPKGARKASAEKYRAMLDALGDAVVMYDPETGGILEVNRRLCQMFGYTPDEARRLPITALWDGHPGVEAQPRPDREASGACQLWEARVQDRAGRSFWVEAVVTPAVSEGRRRMVAVLRDIQARKQGEEALQKREAQYRALAEESLAGVYIIQENRFFYVNPAFARIFGYTVAELVGGMGPLDLIPPEDRTLAAQNIRLLLSESEASMGNPVRGRRQDGTIIYLEVLGRAIEYLGEPAIMGTVMDITARQQAEEALKTQARVLESMAEGVNVADQDGYIVLTNPAFDAMFGYDQGELLGRPVSVLNAGTPEEADQLAREIMAQLHNQSVWQGEVRNRRKDGTPFFTHARISALDISGQTCWITVQEDITQRKRVEVALREKEARFRIVTEGSLAGVYLIQNGIFRYVNPVLAQAFGYEPEEIIDRMGPLDLVHPRERPRIAGDIQRRMTGEAEAARNQFLGLRKDGSVIHCEVLTRPVEYQGRRAVMGTLLDVTERKQAEEALQEANNQLQALIQASPLAIVSLDTDGIVSCWNPAAGRLFGWSPEEILGFPCTPLMPPDQGEEREDFGANSLSDARRDGAEIRCVRKDGSLVDVNLWSAPLYNARGKVSGLISIFADITERKRMEEALKASEANYRTLVEQIPAITYISALDNVFTSVYISPQIRTVLGFTPEEWHADPDRYRQQLHPEDRDRVLSDLILSYSQGGPFLAEYRMYSKSGKVVWLRDESRAVYDRDGRPLFMQGVALDITARKAAEEALQEANNKLRALVEASPLAIIAVDTEGRVISWNPAAETIWGWSQAEVMGRPLPQIPEESQEDAREILRRAHRGESIRGVEQRSQKKDGTNIDICLSTAPLYDAGGKIVGSVGVLEDITDRKRTEAALKNVSRALKAITECHQAMLRASHESELLQEVCRIIVEVGGYRMAWVGFGEHDAKKTIRPMAQAGFDQGYIKGLNLTWADTERGQGPTGTTIRRGVPTICYDIQVDPKVEPWREQARRRGFASMLALPLKDAQTFGALTIYAAEPDALDEEEFNLLVGLANDLTYGITALRARADHRRAEEALKDSEQKLRLLASQLLSVQERERRRVARELHDELGQALTVLKIHLVAIEDKLQKNQQNLKADCEQLLYYIDGVIENVRRLSWDLSPSSLEDLGLSASLGYLVREICRQNNMQEAVTMDKIDHLFSAETQINIYRIFQESLTNIVKHARASRVAVDIQRQDGKVVFEVRDNGVGFDKAEARSRNVSHQSLGLTAMQERALMANGTLKIKSQKGKGTRVIFSIPINQ